MIVVISPSKTLDCKTPAMVKKHSTPELLAYSRQLVEQCRKLDSVHISDLMKVSEKIADLNVKRFAEWDSEFTPVNAKQAILAFLSSTNRHIPIIPEAPLWTGFPEKTNHDCFFPPFHIVPNQFPS